ncbi:MAG: GAF domain-containing protein [Deltaproteobacteria bacterium]|nr:GAF domain-containing protein [Deltaproteobacteria bacterium]MBN2673822.1 GAF domain-containing protein [Deltaproteobacteria bacterium]
MKNNERNADDVIFDFSARSEEFLETFFRKGAEFTEQMLAESQKMKARIQELTEENIQLRSQLASDDAVKDLLYKIQKLEEEKTRIRMSADDAKREFQSYEDRYEEMERELDQMANLYVASSQLHATMESSQVLSVIEQMLMQFVGAASIGIFLRGYDAEQQPLLRPVHAFQCEHISGTTVAWNSAPIGEVAATGVSYITEPESKSDKDTPVACIPLLFGGDVVGVIVVYELLEQKDKFVNVDYELFRLLAEHAASAIIGSGLYARTDSVAAALDCFDSL